MNEIVKELDSISEETPMTAQAKDLSKVFFKICREFSWYEGLRVETKKARNVLQNYLDEGEGLAKRKKKKKRDKADSVMIASKLYIEFFWKEYEKSHKIYEKKLQKKFFENIEFDFDLKWNESFICGNKIDELKEDVKDSITEWRVSHTQVEDIKNLHLENLHTAMEQFGRGLELPERSTESSVIEILTPQILSRMLEYLKVRNYPGYIFTVAPINSALWCGEPKSSVGKYFNREYEYNLTELKEYISKLGELYNEYVETSNVIQKYTESVN